MYHVELDINLCIGVGDGKDSKKEDVKPKNHKADKCNYSIHPGNGAVVIINQNANFHMHPKK